MTRTNEIEKLLKAHNKNKNYPVTNECFIEHCKRYVKAVKEGRMICSIDSVSNSGMSRTMKFLEMSKGSNGQHYLLNFYQLFDVLGYTKVKNSDYFRIGGCGMDMVFATNYNIIHQIHGLGLINKKACSVLAQKTPHVV